MNTKRVRFAETSTLLITKAKSPQELARTWYNTKERNQFKMNATLAAKAIRVTHPEEVKAYIRQSIKAGTAIQTFQGVEYIIGIEHMLNRDVSKLIMATKIARLRCVLQEQERQRQLGQNDVEMLALVSSQVSVFPKLWRRNLAVINHAV
jgi:hypothetical protein